MIECKWPMCVKEAKHTLYLALRKTKGEQATTAKSNPIMVLCDDHSDVTKSELADLALQKMIVEKGYAKTAQQVIANYDFITTMTEKI